ncbi:hypothetical protein GCM10011575_31930 [Microlunatus endophyticus]|uniref:Uncharacterized protein n=1 Tax=Microlunatus endophyticus TaxID=1716077 RepID=A0A917SBZ8_9ACTN|nr:hypothetical protein GCM10011575_31930 [Microlunatus endophyticus]
MNPDRGGPPGQSSPDNLGPLTRREHRHKTFGHINVRQPDPDTRVWKASYGRVLIVNPSSTYDLGTGNLARTLRDALNQEPPRNGPATQIPSRTSPNRKACSRPSSESTSD